MSRSRTTLATVATVVACAGSAHAGGLGRPNSISARAVGWGGAFTAVADDASALHFNPAGMALQMDDSVLVGTETIMAPRTYTPRLSDGTLGPAQKPQNKPAFLPVLGVVSRLSQDGVPSRFALGVGFWNTFGGSLSYDPAGPDDKVINSTAIALLELVPGAAYEVNDFLQVGMAFRFGFGLFSVNSSNRPAGTLTTDLSTSGVGAGVSFGLMVSPSEHLRIGTVWRSAITVDTKGDGKIDFGQGPQSTTASLEQTWPQQGSLGLHWQATPRLGLGVQGDWTDWSRMQRIKILTPIAPDDEVVDFNDNYAVHAGVQFAATDALSLRAGYTFDSNAVPDRTIERTFLDAPKHAVGLGASYVVKRWLVIDTAFEGVGGAVRHVPDNSAQYVDFPERKNRAPGDHDGQIFTLELAAQFRY